MKRERKTPRTRPWAGPVILLSVIVLAIALYVGLESRTGHSYRGEPEEIVAAMLSDIRADIRGKNWAGLGGYGVGSFLSWRNEAALQEYVEEDLADSKPGPVDYVLVGIPEAVTSNGREIRFQLRHPESGTTCRIVLRKSWGLWQFVDIAELGVPSR